MSAPKYAAKTDVPVSKSKDEIEALLTKFGCSAIGMLTEQTRVAVLFERRGLRYRMLLNLTRLEDHQRDNQGYVREASAQQRAWEAETRRLWRAFLLVLKSLLVGVDEGIVTAEEALLAYLMLPGGETVGERVIPEMRRASESGQLPPLIQGLPGAKVIALSERTGS
jgi:hypothetical protein